MNLLSSKCDSNRRTLPWMRPCFGLLASLALSACKPEEANSTSAAPASPPPAASSAAAPVNLSAAFDASSDVSFRLGESAEATLKPLQQVSATPQGDAVALHAEGNDPSVLLPEISFKGAAIVRLDVSAPKDTVAQIFYLGPGQTIYDEQHSVVQPIKAGRNTVYFKLPDANIKGALRFDPGDAPGDYVIHGFEIRGARP